MLSDDASCEVRQKIVNIIITYDILPPPPRALLVQNGRHVWVDVVE